MNTITITPNIRGIFPQGSITFTILQSIDWQKEVLLDPSNTTYECTRVRGNVILAYNPGAASFKQNVNPRAVPPAVGLAGAGAPVFPATTEVAIRRFLEQPRLQITVQSNGVTWLQSPGNGPNGILACDVRNGPFTKVNSVQEIQGERLWKIHLQIETYINESPDVAGTGLPPLIVSNRWYVSEDVGQDHLRKRIYQGICTVRGDVLQAQLVPGVNLAPYVDYFRDQFAGFACPIGHQRTNVKVQVTPDGNTAHYLVEDQEQMFDKGALNPAIRLEVLDRHFKGITPFNRFVAQNAGGFFGVVPIFINRWINGPGADIAKPAEVALSKMYKTIIVRAWGNKTRQRTTLLTYAMRVAFSRMGKAGGIFDPTLADLTVDADSNNFVQVAYTLSWGPDALGNFFANIIQAGALTMSQVTGIGSAGANLLFDQSVSASPNTTTINPLVTFGQTPSANPRFPRGNGTRGTYGFYAVAPAVEYLITQALEQFDAAPASPSAFTA